LKEQKKTLAVKMEPATLLRNADGTQGEEELA